MEYLFEAIVSGAISLNLLSLGGLFLRMRTTESAVAVLRQRVDKVEDAVSAVQSIDKCQAQILEKIKHLPTQSDLKGDVQRLHDRISSQGDGVKDVQTGMAAVVATQEGLRASVDRLHDLELARARGENPDTAR